MISITIEHYPRICDLLTNPRQVEEMGGYTLITLNTERGFVEVESWDDVETLPGFTAELDPKAHQLKEIIGRYIFTERIHCGLTTCHQPHNRGYVVVSKTGPVTNIGRDCGRNHFGVEFEQLSRVFEQARTDQTNREIVGSFVMQLESHEMEVNTLLDPSGRGVHRNIQTFKLPSNGCPSAVSRLLSRMIMARNPSLERSRAATKKEVGELEVMGGRAVSGPQYIFEEVAVLSGFSCLYAENDIRDLLVLDLKSRLADLGQVDVDSLNSGGLKQWAVWCREYESKLDRAGILIDVGRTFLTRENLEKIGLVLDGKDHDQYREYLANFLKKAFQM